MSNLSELLPAGAGAKSADFVASGTLGSGVTVALNSDGTVGVISSSDAGFGSSVVFNSGNTNTNIAAVYDSTNNKIVIAYQDTASAQYGTAIVGTVSGTSISFGTEVVFESARSDYISATFDSASGKIIIAYRDVGNSSYGTAVVGTVSGTSISFGAAVVFESAYALYISATYDSANNKVVIAYRNVDTVSGASILGAVSGTSITFESPVIFNTAITNYISAIYDSTNEKVVIGYADAGNSNYGTAIVGTVSGTSISFGTAVVFESGNSTYISATFDSTNNKIVMAYGDGSGIGTAVVGTVSGTSISFGAAVVFESANSDYNSAIYDSTNEKVVIAYRDVGNSNYGTAIVGTVSGTSISFGTAVVFESAAIAWVSATYDSTNGKVVIAYRDEGGLNYGTAIVYQVSVVTNSADFIGITDQAIANTATGAVIVQGGVSDKVSSLTTGSDYYVQDNGSLSTTVSSVPAGRALSSTSILLEG